MSRIIVEVTGEQHQLIRDIAATEGLSIKDYVLSRILPPTETDDDSHAWNTLREILVTRIKNAKENGVSGRSASEITEDTLARLGKV